jgi:hypothetical protein
MSKIVSFHSRRSLAGSRERFNFSTASVATSTSSELDVDFKADLEKLIKVFQDRGRAQTAEQKKCFQMIRQALTFYTKENIL